MIISRTPFRVSLAGGGTDLPSFYRRNGGAVVSACIKQYMYIAIHPYFNDKIRIKYSKTEDVSDVDDVKHPIVRECLKIVDIKPGIEIASFSDVPAGTGLGSSSAFTVGLLNALYGFIGEQPTKEFLAEQACKIEIDILKEPIGKQDQYAAAFGGLNCIRFYPDDTVEVAPVDLPKNSLQLLEKRLRLYSVGESRNASDVLTSISKALATQDTINIFDTILSQVTDLVPLFKLDELPEIGPILSKGWHLKKQTSPLITNREIEDKYACAITNGATGGKLLGAGAGGFLVFEHHNHEFLEKQLAAKSLPFQVDMDGSKIIFKE